MTPRAQLAAPGITAALAPAALGGMAWVLPRNDAVMKAFVDQRLHLAKARGEYRKTADKWLR